MLTGTWDKYATVRLIKKSVGYDDASPLLKCNDVDIALEWCENKLLAELASFTADQATLDTQTYLADFTAEEMEAFKAMLELHHYEKGDYVCREGDPGDLVYFILSGQVSVSLPLAHRRSGRISTISAGSAFGEMAMLDRGKRSADIVADEKLTCLVLDYNRLMADTGDLSPGLRLKLIRNIGRELTRKLRQATVEIKTLRS